MSKQFLSAFLLLLFAIVMAFPGYGKGLKSLPIEKQFTLSASATTNANWIGILKNCLAVGINMVEEERSTEEDRHQEDHPGDADLEDDFESIHPIVLNTYTHLYSFNSQPIDWGLIQQHLAIPNPPPESNLN